MSVMDTIKGIPSVVIAFLFSLGLSGCSSSTVVKETVDSTVVKVKPIHVQPPVIEGEGKLEPAPPSTGHTEAPPVYTSEVKTAHGKVKTTVTTKRDEKGNLTPDSVKVEATPSAVDTSSADTTRSHSQETTITPDPPWYERMYNTIGAGVFWVVVAGGVVVGAGALLKAKGWLPFGL